MKYQIKATKAEYEIDILGIPFGGPTSKDSDGEWFSPETKLHLDKFPTPPLVYFHGHDEPGKPSATPVYVGKTTGYEIRPDGVWFRGVLDKANEYARRIWEAAKQGLAMASSGSIAHLVRKSPVGAILEWPVAELSVFDTANGRNPANRYAVVLPTMKAMYATAGLTLPDDIDPAQEGDGAEAASKAADATPGTDDEQSTHQPSAKRQEGTTTMSDEIRQAVAEAIKAEREAQAATAKAEADKQAAILDAVKAEREKWEAEAAKSNRLPGGAPAVHVADGTTKYDNTDTADLAFMVATLDAAKSNGRSRGGASVDAYKALAQRLESDEASKAEYSRTARHAMKSAGVKANEINQSTLGSYGDEWVGVAYSGALWESIRQATFVAQRIPTLEFPAGAESLVIPLESTDPTWYKVAQAASLSANPGGIPTNTVTSGNLGTASNTMTLAKMGARVLWTGEMEEDSVLPYVAQLRAQLATSGAEYLESAIIDGDTAAGATTNINDIAGTPGGTEWFMTVNGLRKLALVTNTANSRDAGAFTSADFLETIKLMGSAGRNALDQNKVGFIIDPSTHWAALQLSDVKSRDIFSGATIENGYLRRVYGYNVEVSAHMCKAGGTGLSNAAGKVDVDTLGNNTKGQILAVRWDQWRMGYRRRMTIETTRVPAADSTEIVALMRFGLMYRDTEASAISYNLTV